MRTDRAFGASVLAAAYLVACAASVALGAGAGWIVTREPAPYPGGAIVSTDPTYTNGPSGQTTITQPVVEGKEPDDAGLRCTYVGSGSHGLITVAANGDLTFESDTFGTVGELTRAVNSMPDWRCTVVN